MGATARGKRPASRRTTQVRRKPTEREALTTFVRRAPLAAALVDREMRFLAVSPTWMGDLGAPGERLIGLCSYDVVPETRSYADAHQRVLSGETITGEPDRILLPNGEELWMSWRASPWRDGRGRIAGMLIVSYNMTGQVEAQDEARRSRALAEMIVDYSPQAMVVKDADGRVLLTNQAMQKLYGIEGRNHRGLTVHEVMDAAAADVIVEEDRRAIEGGEPIVVEERRMLPGFQGERVIRKTKAAIRDAHGARYILAISEDITQAKRTQEALEDTRAFLETVIDSIPSGLTVKSAKDGKLLLANQAAARIFGFDRPDENIGCTNEDVFDPDIAARFSERERELARSGGAQFYEADQINTRGGIRYINQLKSLIPSAKVGDYILTISEDVTERKQAADELQRTRAFLETVIESMPAGITVKDASTGRLLMTNPAVEEIFGVGRNENIGKTNGEVFSRELADKRAAQDREVIETGETRVYEDDPVETRSGLKYLRRRKVLIPNNAGPDYLLSISEDVTERKLAQDALKEALARAEAASVAKSEFLANMSHEIRTPLNGVLGLADALTRMDLSADQLQIVQMIVSSGKALTAILSDVLDLAKAEAGQLQLSAEPFSLRETIGSAAFLFQAVAEGKGVGFAVEFDPDGPDQLIGDPLRLRQVVSNLISNAVKFTAQGEVRVSVAARLGPDGSARVSVKVKDTGPGFSDEVRARLFSRFEQGDGSITRRYGGTGLGLSIASALAQMMRGQIDCRARPGQGAVFVFRAQLKVNSASADAAPSHARAEPKRLDRRLRVLLAEDHEINQKVVQLMLGGAAELVIVADGRAAVEQALTGDRFDVILMDTQMPLMDGLSATRLIREEEARAGLSRTPIISLTANAMAHQVRAALEAGADGHLAKPITADGLFGAIEKALSETVPAPEVSAA